MPIGQVGMAAVNTGLNLAGSALGGGMGLLFGAAQRRADLKQQEKLQRLQIQGQKEMGDYNLHNQLKLWEQTGYGAQVDQLKRAGLNAGLIYGMGGAGGQTASAQPGTVTGATAGGQEAIQGMGMMTGMALNAAQIENIKANTEKTKVETAKTAGVDTAEAQARIADLSAGVKEKEAKTQLAQVQTKLTTVQTEIQESTKELQVDQLENLVREGTIKLEMLQRENKLADEQYNDKVKMFRLQMAEITIKNALNKAITNNTNQDTKNKIQEIKESEARIKTMAAQLDIAWSANDLNWYKIELDSPARVKAAMDNLKDEGWEELKDLIPGIILPVGRGMVTPGHTPVKGFGRK